MIINQKKNQQIEINKKPLNPVKTKEKNGSVAKAGYYIFTFMIYNSSWLSAILFSSFGKLAKGPSYCKLNHWKCSINKKRSYY